MSRKKTAQDFQFGSRLGEGSYSQVFKAVDTSSRKVFAIKVLSKKHIVKEKKIKYVNIEKITLNRLGRHPGIVTLYYTFQDENSLYFVIDLAEYGELLTLIRKLGSLSENCAKYYMAQLIDAVDFMHKRGVIHRDLKPENILLNGDMKLMITDFGAAKLLDLGEQGQIVENEEAFAKGSFVGTAEYVSPELLKHNKCGFESDIWAIGCILYQFIIGVPPFKGKTEYATFEKIVNLQYQWPNYFIPELVKDIVSRLLKSDPLERLTIVGLQQHPWFSRLNWDDKSKIWGVSPPKLEQYRPLVEQQLQQNTQQMGKIVIQKKLPAATVKKQLLNNTINQIRSDTGNNHLYNGVSKDSSKKPQPLAPKQFAPPPPKSQNGTVSHSPSSSSSSPTPVSPIRPRLPQIQHVSPHRRVQIPQQQFTPSRPSYSPGQVHARSGPTQQPPPQTEYPGSIRQSPASQGSSPRRMRPSVQQQQQQQLPSRSNESTVALLQPPRLVMKTPTMGKKQESHDDEETTLPTIPSPISSPIPSPVPKASLVSAPSSSSSSNPPVANGSKTVPNVKSSSSTVKPQQTVLKPVSKPPQLSLPPKPKGQAKPLPPKLLAPTLITKKALPSTNAKPTLPKKQSPSATPSPRAVVNSNGVIRGPTEVLKRLNKDEHIVKLDFINFTELNFASIRTFDPSSSLSQLNKSMGLDDVVMHEIITRNKHELENGTKRVVLAITDMGNLFLFNCTNIQLLTYEMGVDLTDKMFAMYDYEFSEFGESGYLILEVLKQDKLVFLSPLTKQVKRDLLEAASIQQGIDLSWIEALMKTKELLKKKNAKSSPPSSSSSRVGSSSSTARSRSATPTNGSSVGIKNSPSNGTIHPTKRVSSSSTTSVKGLSHSSSKNVKPKTTQQIQQQNKKFAGGAAAAAFKTAR